MLQPLCTSLLAKIDEQLERTTHLFLLIPEDKLSWTPAMPKAFSTGLLLGHLLECCAGVCAALYAARPARMAHFLGLNGIPVNQNCTPSKAREYLSVYTSHIHEGFNCLLDTDLSMNVPTVFVPSGELLLTVMLGNLEHLINHKHQLFMYLQMMGANVSSRDLYHFREQVDVNCNGL